ncbi:T6SS effector phospholipase Tle3 domain-containing protein [Klebsiella sp. WOUb02]|uniref:T6SS effector phospholipase Tle3 domain-containing protein n=1 Tax=Klebsiella sp. WOUb02 TaxID=3161071 RepID=UPI003CE95D45
MKASDEPTREASCVFDDNGKPHYRSSRSPKSVKVRAECKHPPHLSGIIIFVHGVNSTGEWFAAAEQSLCGAEQGCLFTAPIACLDRLCRSDARRPCAFRREDTGIK